jgi:hypothetical protein
MISDSRVASMPGCEPMATSAAYWTAVSSPPHSSAKYAVETWWRRRIRCPGSRENDSRTRCCLAAVVMAVDSARPVEDHDRSLRWCPARAARRGRTGAPPLAKRQGRAVCVGRIDTRMEGVRRGVYRGSWQLVTTACAQRSIHHRRPLSRTHAWSFARRSRRARH